MTKKWYEEEVGENVIAKKYLHEGETGITDMVNRIAACFSPALQDFVRDSIPSADFFPAGRSLYALGCKGKFKATTSNCYIMPCPEDDTHSINMSIDEMESIFKRGGGCGVNLSRLRPRGAKVQNSARTSTGAVSFMEKFDVSARTIGANNRRAALLIGLNCDHPDLEEFLQVKQNDTAIQAANISILFTDEFMKTTHQKNAKYELKFDVEATGEKIRKEIDAAEFFQKFCDANREYAEPGAIFIDRVRTWNLLSADKSYLIEIPNPCAEYFGNAYNACNLGSFNLYNLVENKFTDDAVVRVEALQAMVDKSVRALDEILDYGYDLQPLDTNRQNINDYRAIGLGVFGLADALIALGIKYGSEKSIRWCDRIFRIIFEQALWTSNDLAREKGMFAKCDPEILLKAPILEKINPELRTAISLYGLRNASLISVAPTGTISTMCGLSGGAEPLFKISYKRTTHSLVKEGKYFDVYAKSVKDLLEHHGMPLDTPVEEVQKQFRYVVDSHDVAPINRVRLQAAIQTHVDNAISSTVNMKAGSTTEEVSRVYNEAWKLGCKGVTVFVDGCKRTPIMVDETATPDDSVHNVRFDYLEPIHYTDIIGDGNDDSEGLSGKRYRGKTACVPKLYTHVYQHEGHIYEVFTSAQSGGCQANIATITKLASSLLRSGVKVQEVIRILKDTPCPACLDRKKAGVKVSNSCGACVGEALEKYYGELQGIKPEKPVAVEKKPAPVVKERAKEPEMFMACPECGEYTLRPEGRCNSCHNCGYSKCS